ncbi:MAG: hypothetical protein HOO96_16455 [Polyangiaceae bacterium]|nr:hypothetical protein [Polyangiaceae bacterium]
MTLPRLAALAFTTVAALSSTACTASTEEPTEDEVAPEAATAPAPNEVHPANGYTLVSQSYCSRGLRLSCDFVRGTCQCR